MTDINFKGVITLEDKQAREMIDIMNRRIDAMNERTKKHTRSIKELEKKE